MYKIVSKWHQENLTREKGLKKTHTLQRPHLKNDSTNYYECPNSGDVTYCYNSSFNCRHIGILEVEKVTSILS